jgi:PucR family transcriptional regulator, purine catabolism regulatory protein
MSLTVAEILAMEPLRSAEPEVVAGASHLARPVRWVHISEQPDVAGFLKGGELLLLTGIGLGEDPASQARFADELADVGAAAIAVRLGAAFDRLPPALVERAEARGLPLVALHRRIAFVTVTEAVHAAIINRQVELLEKADLVRREFTGLVMRGVGLHRILERLSTIVACSVVLEDAAHQVVEIVTFGSETSEILDGWETHARTGHAATGEGEVHLDDEGCAWVSIALRGEPWGRVHLVQPANPFDDIDLLAIDRAADAIGLALLTDRETRSLGEQARRALISDLVHERFGSPDEFVRRGRSLGVALEDQTLVAIVLELSGFADLIEQEGLDEHDRAEARTGFLESLRGAIRAQRSVSLSATEGDRVVAVVGIPAELDERTVAARIGVDAIDAIAGRWGDHVAPVVGISDAATPTTLRRAVEQATEAAAYGAKVQPGAGVHRYADLGIYHLLLPLGEGPELARFVEDELGPLMRHDVEGRTPLLATLRVYLDHGGRATAAAAELHVERRTLYRLDRIAQLLGRDLREPETRLRLGVALRGLELLRRRDLSGRA